MVSHRFDAQMKIDLFLKDFNLLLEEGRRLGVALPLTSMTQQLATAAAAAGRGEEDLAAVVTTLERLGGLKEDRLAAKRNAPRGSIASKRRHRQ
jgi:2-hydroxy-3-oxopropionate reductase